MLQCAVTGEPDWMTLGQAAKYLGVAQSTIRKWSDQGRLPAFYTPGGHRRYRLNDVEAYLASEAFQRRQAAVRAERRNDRTQFGDGRYRPGRRHLVTSTG